MKIISYVKIRTLLIVLLLAIQVQAEVALDRITALRHSQEGEALRLVVETGRKPQASVFFASGPERLVIEFNDAVPATKAPPKPRNKIVRSLGLKQVSLNRSRVVLNLNYRPPTSGLKVKVLDSPPRLLVEIPNTSPERKEKFALTEGVKWLREDRLMDGRWVRLNRLLFNPKDPKIEVRIGLAKEKTNARETVTSMVKRYKALAGINGGFFASSGGALGLVYRDGRMLVPHVSRRPPRSGFGLSSRGRPMIGRIASAGPAIKDLDGGDWSAAKLAIGGGPRLLKNGKAKITAKLEELGPGGNDITRVAGRTVVGITKKGRLLFGTVSGFKDNHSQGAKFEPVVSWLKSVGVKEAVNFDGGASVDMVVGRHIVSDGPGNATREKPVATAILIKDSRERLYPSEASWSLESRTLPADGKTIKTVKVKLTTPEGKPVPDGTEVRFFAHNLRVKPALAKTSGGKVEVKVRSSRLPGKAKLTLEAGPMKEDQEFRLRGGKAKRLQLVQGSKETITTEEGKMQMVKVKIQLTDQWGNPVQKAPLEVIIDGSEPYPFRTDQLGMMVLDVQAYPEGGLLKVSNPDAGTVSHQIGAL